MSRLTASPPVEHETAVDGYLERFFEESLARADTFAADYRRLWAATRDATSGGKRIRPRLLLAAHHAYAGRPSDDAVAMAAAFELLHTAFLMHDDVIDHDLVRRGEPNVAGRFALDAAVRGASRQRADDYGQASAILAGDLLIAAAYTIAARLEAPAADRRAVLDVLDDCVFAAAAGEHADVRHAIETAPGEADILAKIEEKTACYSFSGPLRIGALLGGADARAIAELDEIGRRMGVAFQLRDDVLGVYGDERVTGKSTLGDLREGKQTLLIAYARGHAAWLSASSAFGDPALDEAAARSLRRAIEASGARARVEALIERQRAVALRGIRDADLPEPLAGELVALVAAEAGRRR